MKANVKKILATIVDGTDSFMAFFTVIAGVFSSQVIKMLNSQPDLVWAQLFHNLASPRFIIFGLVAVMLVGQEERKGASSDVARAAKKANFWSRMERAFSRGFMYTGVGTVG